MRCEEKEAVMKVCPVCGARAFDDAATCYGCLHRFDEEGCAESSPDIEAEIPVECCEATCVEGCDADEGGRRAARTDRFELAPSFLVRFTPVSDETGGVIWSCAIETS